jgi:hypothetical protein
MCAKTQEQKPVEENGRQATAKARTFGVDTRHLRSTIGPQVVGFQAGRAWAIG